jgi:hypothetical protein
MEILIFFLIECSVILYFLRINFQFWVLIIK